MEKALLIMKFLNLQVWQRSVELSAEIYRETAALTDFGFRDQITRSALSIPSIIAEGYERESLRETRRFLDIAKGSTGELFTQVIVGNKAGLLDDATAQRWQKESEELGKMLGGLRKRFLEP